MPAKPRTRKPSANGHPAPKRVRIPAAAPEPPREALAFRSTHASLTAAIGRPPGAPESGCVGLLVPVDAAGQPLGFMSRAYLDDAQADEGPVGSLVGVELYRCSTCEATLVVAVRPDGSRRLRNSWRPSRWDHAARKPVDVVS